MPEHRPTLPELFVGFLVLSLCGFGGPVLWARRILVERRRWLSDAEFVDLLGLCQFLPGPNMVSIAVCTGSRFRGPAGALTSLAGFMVIPFAIGLVLGIFFLDYARIGAVQGALRGISATAAGLIVGTGLRLLWPRRRRPLTLIFAALAFTALALARLPLLPVVLGLVPLSIATAAVSRKAAR